ncbi:hypothetical protein [Arthrobacter sp. NPDC057013]|uniref:hypothetical protein n=1 Tax=Arthrobacter sp. NPDC057013 TaxID=3345999 RepID=UPI003629C8D5
MLVKELLPYLHTPKQNYQTLAKELNVVEKKLRSVLTDDLGFVYSNKAPVGWSFNGDEDNLDKSIYSFIDKKDAPKRTKKNLKEREGTNKNAEERKGVVNDNYSGTHANSQEPLGTKKNSNEPEGTDTFSTDEIKILKLLVKERQENAQERHTNTIHSLLNTYIVNGAETTRSSFNLSNSTIQRLNEFAKENKLQKQDIVELALIQLLNRFM